MHSVIFLSLILSFFPNTGQQALPLDSVVLSVATDNDKGPSWKSYGEALKAAEESGKKVIVDVYTDWCHWCKKMDKNVYADKKVRAYLDENFITVKLNAESKDKHSVQGEDMTETEIARAFGIRSFPTTVFLNSEGKPITIVPGYIESGKFVKVLRYINEEHYKDTKWEDFLNASS
jgi:thioredoxin-related protein